jgi:hypothetical protein
MEGRRIQRGELVELTASQALAFADKFEPVSALRGDRTLGRRVVALQPLSIPSPAHRLHFGGQVESLDWERRVASVSRSRTANRLRHARL